MMRKIVVVVPLFLCMVSIGLHQKLMVDTVKTDFVEENEQVQDYQEDEPSLVISEDEWNANSFIEAVNVGWNLGDALGSSAQTCGYDQNLNLETNWGNPPVSKELIDYIASLGFNTIRIPVTWCYNCGRDEAGHLIVGKEWMNRVHEVIDYALENDMYVIMNTMCDSWELFACGVVDNEKWAGIQQDAKDLWSQIAEDFKEYDEKLLFESFNELDNMEASWQYSDLAANQMNTLNQIFVDSVRNTGGNNKTRILIVPTFLDSAKTNSLDAFVLPKDVVEQKLVVTIHNYQTEFDQDIEIAFQVLERFSKKVGAPILIGEFGFRDDYELPQLREAATSNFVARAAKYNMKCCVWDDGYHWKLIDRYDFSNTDLNMINALFDGVNGKEYETKSSDKVVINQSSHFYFGEMDLQTGEIQLVDYQTKFWASLTTRETEGSFLPILRGDKVFVNLKAINEAVEFGIHWICFLDENMNVISSVSGKNIFCKSLYADIPEGACYYAVNTYDPYTNFKYEEIEQMLNQNELQITITFIDSTEIAE